MTTPSDLLYPHQQTAVESMHNGCLLCGGVGTGKSITSLYYYYYKECGVIKKPLYIITTARKRDTGEWLDECSHFDIPADKITIDSWNNIGKYQDVRDAFFIFDEQRVVGKGTWSKMFIRIARANRWILLSATPGDTWMDYIPLFIANGYYKHRTDFIRQHVVFNPYVKWQQVDHYINVEKLVAIKDRILVNMEMNRHTIRHVEYVNCNYNMDLYKSVMKDRWDIYEKCPIDNVSRLCSIIRRIVNEDPSRILALKAILYNHPKTIIFYNFDYELELMKEALSDSDIVIAEWNGHRHESIPKTDKWAYLVQYTAGSEGWNCVETDCIVFYSQSYSYKSTEQAKGRIDRLNTPFTDLYYYFLVSKSPIDMMISKSLRNKRDFNEGRVFKLWFEKGRR
jgi:hypothetical protein